MTDWGEVLILPPEFADEIRNDHRLSFARAAMQDNHAGIPRFETVRLVGRDDQLIQKVARKYLTKHLSMVIEPLSRETTLAVSPNFGESVDEYPPAPETTRLTREHLQKNGNRYG
ncbi:hypothetical protein ACHAPT_012999 [Fusarium lateritium]